VFSKRKTGSRVDRSGEFQIFGERPFEEPHNPYPVPKLPMKSAPRNRSFTFKHGEAVTQPQINIEGHWAVPNSLHGRPVNCDRMPPQSLKERRAEANPPDERFTVIAHPAVTTATPFGLAASAARRSSRTERRFALAVLTTERNAA